ncbi:MAG TPA: hypothetical protein VE779_14415 [Candidatus Angelobacter sp.]|nr:hypothetical protein [Candidatus Angelobacter sp.]
MKVQTGLKNAGFVREKVVAAAVLAMLAAPLWAQSTQTSRVYRDGNAWVEETTGTLPAGHEFRALTDMGSLQVQGSATQVTYVVRKRSGADTEEAARKQFEQLRITANKIGDAVVLEGHVMGRNINRLAAEFAVQIPRLTQVVRAETRGGTLSLSAIQGMVTGMTGGGNVKLDDLAGPVKVQTGGGNMEAVNVTSDMFLQSGGGSVAVDRVSGQLMVKTGGGKIKIGTSGTATLETGGGNIDVGRCNGDLRADSGGGNLNLGDVTGSVNAETGGGNVRLSSAQGYVRVRTGGGVVELWKVGQGANVETGSGAVTVEFVGGRGQFRDSELRTASGSMVVYLPSNLGVSLHASTELASGVGIRSDLSGLAITSEGGQYGPKSMFAEGQLNGGGPSLRVRTAMGQIEFKRSQQ